MTETPENPVFLTKFEEGQTLDFQTFLQESIKNVVIKFVLNVGAVDDNFDHTLKMLVSGLLYPHFDEYNVIITHQDNDVEKIQFSVTIHYKDHTTKVRSWDFRFDFVPY